MKTIVISIAAGVLLATLAPAQPPRYTVTDLGAVGNTLGQTFFVTNNSLVSGAAPAADTSVHAVLWYQGVKIDIGTPGLGGPAGAAAGGHNSSAFAVDERGQAVGEAATSTADPNGEDFCGFKSFGLPSSGTTCVPFVRQYFAMTPLPTLGGNNGMAHAINSRGVVAGTAEATFRDPACPAPQVLQFKPVVWENGKVRELPTYPGDLNGIAFGINGNGDIAGASGECAAFNPAYLVNLQPLHALLWQTGTVTDLGNLGGTGHGSGIQAYAVNRQDQVVGYSDLPGDTAFHSFLWTKETGMKDLRALPGDVASLAIDINDAGDVVGISLDANFNLRAYLWENGVMTDLNTLVNTNPPIPDGSPLFLASACSINSRGVITGFAIETSTGEIHGYLATPTASSASSASSGETGGSTQGTLSESARELLRQRMPFGRRAALAGPR
jgi:probable HAF family extracellular repeat protein